ncbi:MAG: DUF1553 domain-containing protein [Verrucomicrobiales bacterium]|nr:DUF1553 domain-containing protein [Verrucomicrobiales bacterium]
MPKEATPAWRAWLGVGLGFWIAAAARADAFGGGATGASDPPSTVAAKAIGAAAASFPARPEVPETRDREWPRDEIDRFVLARLEREGLRSSPEADRTTWLRRVTLDLTGLPPAPDDLEAFLNDEGEAARERVVARLLASPAYGERWAQHWLDVVRFADTHGFEVNTERPNAWPYRDYVIRAFNADTPYDRFVREQIVGDASGEDAATGFLVTASVLLPGQIGADEPSKRLARQDALDEIVVNLGQTFLGASIGCARCHDHKTDPIPQREYYAMQAFVAGVEYEDRDLRTTEAEVLRAEERDLRARLGRLRVELTRFAPLAGSGVRRPAPNARLNVDRFSPVRAKRLRFTVRQTNRLEPCIDECEVFDVGGTNVALATAGATVTSSGDMVVADRHELRFVNDGRYGNASSWMSNEAGKGWVTFEFAGEPTIDRVVWGRDRDGEFSDRLATDYVIEVADATGVWRPVADAGDRAKPDEVEPKGDGVADAGLGPGEREEKARLEGERKRLEARLTEVAVGQRAFAGRFRKPDTIRVLRRGDPEQPKDEVVPAVPRMFDDLALPPNAEEQERRRALADWIASPRNPRTARVMANRIWQWHFGTGLVETPSDFGKSGAKPTHPDLLDWLASEFVRGGWSMKALHRRIVLSATYRQSGRRDSAAAAKDSEARLLWRFPSRRLEAEAIRDSMLAVSGRLNRKMYGPGFDLFDKRGGLTGFKPVEVFDAPGRRRMIYAHKVRREREAVFGAFDCPDAGQSAARRRESTTPIQALNLFNSRFTLDEAEAFAARVRLLSGDDVAGQVRNAYRWALGREPDADERGDAEPVVRAHGLAALCRVLFNCNEFLFLP